MVTHGEKGLCLRCEREGKICCVFNADGSKVDFDWDSNVFPEGEYGLCSLCCQGGLTGPERRRLIQPEMRVAEGL
jgi:hypothetical protein